MWRGKLVRAVSKPRNWFNAEGIGSSAKKRLEWALARFGGPALKPLGGPRQLVGGAFRAQQTRKPTRASDFPLRKGDEVALFEL